MDPIQRIPPLLFVCWPKKPADRLDIDSEPKWKTVVALADALGVSTEAFRNGDEPAEVKAPAKKKGK